MATKKTHRKIKSKTNPPGGNYEVLRNKDSVTSDGRARYWDTFDMGVGAGDQTRDVTFSLPEKIKKPISLQFEVIREPDWPAFVFYYITLDAIPSDNYACRVSFVGEPIDSTHIYRCAIQVWATPASGKDIKKKKKSKGKTKK